MINELMAANLLFIKETSYWKGIFYYKFCELSLELYPKNNIIQINKFHFKNQKKTLVDLAEVFGV